jgi:hypothetical protein
MRSHSKNGRALLAWSIPLLVISSGFAFVAAKEHRLSLSLAMPTMLAIGVVSMAFAWLAQILDDGRDETWRSLSGYCFAITSVAGMTALGSLNFCLHVAGGGRNIFSADLMILPTAIGLVIFAHIVASATGLRLFSAAAGIAVQSLILSTLMLMPHETMTCATAAIAATATLCGLLRLRAKNSARP